MPYHIGIDNGLDGGVVVLDESGALIEKYVTPVVSQKTKAGKEKRLYDVPAMIRILEPRAAAARAYLERAQPMPLQGVVSTFSTGYGYGLWTGMLTALGIPFETVTPQAWQKAMFRGIAHFDTKAASSVVASRLSPKTDWRATERSRKHHDGLTDAFCIAEYGRSSRERFYETEQ